MKKFIIIITLILIYCITPASTIVMANTHYARATESTFLYKLTTSSTNLTEIILIVEKIYFVEILSENSSNYKVNYNGQIGYVKKNDVELVSNIPNTPFPNNIQIIICSDCNLRSTPTTKSSTNNIITTLHANEKNIQFIGRIFADEVIDFGGTTWYYIKYNNQYGYIYNKYVKSITPIYENKEESVPVNDLSLNNTNPLTDSPSLIIIILLFIPIIIILFILYLPREKLLQHNKKSKHKEIKEKY